MRYEDYFVLFIIPFYYTYNMQSKYLFIQLYNSTINYIKYIILHQIIIIKKKKEEEEEEEVVVTKRNSSEKSKAITVVCEASRRFIPFINHQMWHQNYCVQILALHIFQFKRLVLKLNTLGKKETKTERKSCLGTGTKTNRIYTYIY